MYELWMDKLTQAFFIIGPASDGLQNEKVVKLGALNVRTGQQQQKQKKKEKRKEANCDILYGQLGELKQAPASSPGFSLADKWGD
jgi:hypothetical protein